MITLYLTLQSVTLPSFCLEGYIFVYLFYFISVSANIISREICKRFQSILR